MKVIEQSFEIISLPENLLQTLEKAGRTCYKSEDKITEDSAAKFVEMLIKRGHHAMIEFGDIIVKCITNRGVTHEIVRHRLSSYAQESTRYVNYKGGMEFIRPVWMNKLLTDPEYDSSFKNLPDSDIIWLKAMAQSENSYLNLLDEGWRPEQAREVLPNSLKTEIVWKANIREWRHIFTLRTSPKAHPQMVALMTPLLKYLQSEIPVVFDDL